MLEKEGTVKIFKALGNKTRLMILENILDMPYVCAINEHTTSKDIIKQAACVGTIASEFHYSLPTISRHLKELKDAKIINMTKRANKIYVEPNYETLGEIREYFLALKVTKQER